MKHHANVVLASERYEATAALAHGLGVVLWLHPPTFGSDNATAFSAWVSDVLPNVVSGYAEGDLVALYIDEPFWNGEHEAPTPTSHAFISAQITTLANAAHSLVPGVPFAMNEAAWELDSTKAPVFAIPTGVDWVGFDCYTSFDPCSNGPSTRSIPYYYNVLRAAMSTGQRMFLVPPSSVDMGVSATYSHSDLVDIARQGNACSSSSRPTCSQLHDAALVAKSYDSLSVHDSVIVAVFGFTGATDDEVPGIWSGALDHPTLDSAYHDIYARVPGNTAAYTAYPTAALLDADSVQNLDNAPSMVAVPVTAKTGTGAAAVSVNVVCTPSAGSSLTSPSIMRTDANGVARFYWQGLSTSGHRYTLSCETPNLPTQVRTFSATVGSISTAFASLGGSSWSVMAGVPIPFSAMLLWSDGSPVEGEPVSCTTSGGSISGSKTNASGVTDIDWTPSAAAGTYTATCTARGGASLTVTAITHTYHAAAASAQSWSDVAAGAATPTNPYFQLLDESNHPVDGNTIRCTPSGTSSTTWTDRVSGLYDGTGLAAFVWTLGTAPATYTLACTAYATFAHALIAGPSLTFSATVLPSVYHFLEPNGQSWSPVHVGTPTPLNPYVQLIDSSNRAINGVPVTCVPSGSSTVSWSTRVTGQYDGTGQSAFVWTMGSTPGNYSLACTAPAPFSASYTFNATAATYHAATPNGASWTPLPSSSTGGNPYVELLNGSNAHVDSVTITCSPSSGSSLLWNTRVTGRSDGAGMSAFVWTVGSTPGAYTLTCTSPAPYNTTTTFTATATAAPYHATAPNGSTWSTPPNTSTPGNPYVELFDANNVRVDGVTITCAPSSGSSVLWTTRTTGQYDGTGMSAFVWTVGSTPGAYTLTCTSPPPYSTTTTFTAIATP